MFEPPAIVVAIDGPAGAGKSTVARRVARATGFTLVDTGAIYRVVALQAIRLGVGPENETALKNLADAVSIRFVAGASEDAPDQVFVGEEDFSAAIRTPEVSEMAARVSARPSVRKSLVALQRRLAGLGNAVLEGRDIGTVIYPDAALKFFLSASLSERARRRHEELLGRGETYALKDVEDDIRRRDTLDAERATAPLRAADDAVRLDSTTQSPEQVVATIVAAIERLTASSAAGAASGAAATPVAPAAAQATPDLAELFADILPARLQRYIADHGPMGGTYTFEATGPGGGTWSVDLDASPPQIVATSNPHASCRVIATSPDLQAMLEGRLHPQKAFMQGQLVIQGDVTMALRLGALLA